MDNGMLVRGEDKGCGPALVFYHKVYVLSLYIHTWRAIVFIQPGIEDMSIIVFVFKVLVD